MYPVPSLPGDIPVFYDEHFLCICIAGNYRLRHWPLTKNNWLFSDPTTTKSLSTLPSLVEMYVLTTYL